MQLLLAKLAPVMADFTHPRTQVIANYVRYPV
jgi:hypothetical protein